MPDSYAESPDGVLLIANGIDPMLRWDGMTINAERAGVSPPEDAPDLAISGTGDISGTYYAYVRFIDRYGNVSGLSPISDALNIGGNGEGIQGLGGSSFQRHTIWDLDLQINGALQIGGPSRVNSGTPFVIIPGHNLTTGMKVTLTGLSTCLGCDGTWSITVRDSLTVGGPTVISADDLPADLKKIVTDNQIEGWTRLSELGFFLGAGVGTYAANLFNATKKLKRASITGAWTPGEGTYTVGGDTITYTNVPISDDPKVVRRQILRNTNGQTSTYYVDVDTANLTATTFTSTRSDENLLTQEEVPLFDDSLAPLALRYGEPPSHKAHLAHHLGRMFAAGETPYTIGTVTVNRGDSTVTGNGTAWPASLAGRFLYVKGATRAYEIDEVDAVNQTLTLVDNSTTNQAAVVEVFIHPVPPPLPRGPNDGPWSDADVSAGTYSIRPAPGERRLVYFTEAGQPENWPAINAFAIQEDGDEITGLMTMGSFLYILEKEHIYRFTYQSDPATDGYVFLSANRGCVNNRCWVIVEDTAYMLSEAGIHAFSGGQDSQPISTPIQDLWYPQATTKIVWDNKAYFHAAWFPSEEVIRWFVCLDNSALPQHAIAYHYRNQHWWTESYSVPISASAVATVDGKRRTLLAGARQRVVVASEGTLDGPNPDDGTVRGTVTSATSTTLVDSTATFPATGLVGSPLVIVSGTGKGQVRVIDSVDGTELTISAAWTTTPDTTSVYQIGGIPWTFTSGWFRWAESEVDNPRKLAVAFQPVTESASMDMRIYQDHSDTATTFQTAYTSDEAAGVQSEQGSANLVADLTKSNGYVQKRLDYHNELNADGARFVSVELAGVTNEEEQKIYQVNLDGATQ